MVFDQLAISFFSSQRHRPLYCSVISSSSPSHSHNDEPFAGESSSGVLLGLLVLYVRLYMLHSCLPLRRALYFPRVVGSPAPQASGPSAASDSSPGAYSSKKGLSFVKPKTYSQLQSPFFRLPTELRSLIYRQAYGNEPVHVVPMHRRLGSFLCTRPTSSDMLWSSQRTCWDRQHTREDHRAHGRPSLYSYLYTDINILPLLLTCRTM